MKVRKQEKASEYKRERKRERLLGSRERLTGKKSKDPNRFKIKSR